MKRQLGDVKYSICFNTARSSRRTYFLQCSGSADGARQDTTRPDTRVFGPSSKVPSIGNTSDTTSGRPHSLHSLHRNATDGANATVQVKASTALHCTWSSNNFSHFVDMTCRRLTSVESPCRATRLDASVDVRARFSRMASSGG